MERSRVENRQSTSEAPLVTEGGFLRHFWRDNDTEVICEPLGCAYFLPGDKHANRNADAEYLDSPYDG